ncbi:MAG: Hpt domain-containing protein [Deltaproteobacteria bacterium]|nr:Hpt domain-containing protein [Deltaproteobacteria bacterium]
MEFTDNESRIKFWAPRVKSILNKYIQQVEHTNRPHPELLDMLTLAIDRFMELAYEMGALESCLTVSRLSLLLAEIQANNRKMTDCRGEIEEARVSLEGTWNKEIRDMGVTSDFLPPGTPLADTITDWSGLGQDENSPPNSQTAPQTLEANSFSQPPSNGSEFNGTFGYLGTSANHFDPELTTMFLTELPEQLQQVENLILTLEGNSNNPEVINDMFRILHTIKGNSGFLGLMEFTRLGHSMESMLDAIRKKRLGVSQPLAQLLLEGIDAMNGLNANLKIRFDQLTKGTQTGEPAPVEWEGLKQTIENSIPSDS